MIHQTIREKVQYKLANSRESDPHKIARTLVSKLTDAEKRELVLTGLETIAREEVRFARMAQDANENARPTGRSRWRQLMPERVSIGGAWMFLNDCGVAELLNLAEQYEARAEANAIKAQEARALAAELEASGFETVGELRLHDQGEAA